MLSRYRVSLLRMAMLHQHRRLIHNGSKLMTTIVQPTSPSRIIFNDNNYRRMAAMFIQNRGIKTTKKEDSTHVEVYDPEYMQQKKPKGPETAEEFADVSSQKNWISFGYDRVDQKEDYHLANAFFFSYFTLCFLGFCFIVYYYPYMDGYDWAVREAFLELDRRERLGLPLIDPNLVPPEQIHLPSDEELGDFEIHL